MYYLEKFLAIQNAIARNLIKSLNFVGEIPEILVQAMPYPAHTKDEFLLTMQSFGSIFFLFSFNYTFMSTIRFVSTEKEKQLKEAMKIMGLPLWIHWFSWFVRTIIMLSISMIGITILLKVNRHFIQNSRLIWQRSLQTFTPSILFFFFSFLFLLLIGILVWWRASRFPIFKFSSTIRFLFMLFHLYHNVQFCNQCIFQ